MPAFDIYYFGEQGEVSCAFTVQFDHALRAKVLALAMKPAECRELEVWQGADLVYRRPEMDDALDAAGMMAHRRPNARLDVGSPA